MISLGVAGYNRSARAWERLQLLPDFNTTAGCDSFWVRDNVDAFVQTIDSVSLKTGRTIWLEKTPGHLFCAKRIQQYIPDAKFIHIIRNGPDNVASLFDAAKKYPAMWGKNLSIDHAIWRWNTALRESLQYREDPQHYLVRYEELISDPVKVLSGLCEFLGCDFDPKMVENYSEKAANLIRETEPWKQGNLGPIRNNTDTKFQELFSPEQQEYIRNHLERWDV